MICIYLEIVCKYLRLPKFPQKKKKKKYYYKKKISLVRDGTWTTLEYEQWGRGPSATLDTGCGRPQWITRTVSKVSNRLPIFQYFNHKIWLVTFQSWAARTF